jgi:hypothetical protein
MRSGFDRVDRDLRDLRGEVGALRIEMREEIGSLRSTLLRVGGGTIVGLIGVIAAILVRGG